MIKALDFLLSGGSGLPNDQKKRKRNCCHSVQFSFCS